MRAIFIVVLVVGVGIAGFATYMAKNYIGSYQTALAEERSRGAKAIPITGVYIATRALRYGEQLSPEDVQKVRWPADAVPEGSFTTQNPIFAEGDPSRYVLRTMEKGEPIMGVKVSEPGQDAGLTSRLDRGMRAFAIKVDESTGVSGFLRPGDRVDVYWTGSTRGLTEISGNQDVTKLIETGVKIIAIDQTANGDDAEVTIASTITVAATPQQVAALTQGQSTGRLSLSLVGADDETVAEAIEVNQSSLLGITQQAAVISDHVEPEICTIRSRRGVEVIVTEIPCTN